MPLQPLSPLEISICKMEQQLQAILLELKHIKALAAEQKGPQPKRDLVYLFGKSAIRRKPRKKKE